MRVAFYAPFKPLDHPNPSGDQTIGRGLVHYLDTHGCDVSVASRFRARWLYRSPAKLARIPLARRRALTEARTSRAEIWLTYHTYYKAPDVIGPWVAAKLGIPYVIFQGIYSTKVRRRWSTLPGFLLNRRALRAAEAVFSNKKEDVINLERIIAPGRLVYLSPGIYPDDFERDESARARLRREWQAGETPHVMAAAMFRDDVKTRGLVFLMESLALLAEQNLDFGLVLAGDGPTRRRLQALAEERLPGRVRFLGKVPRPELPAYYSACDVFAFPGIRESLGMVYLEAQSCGLPVVAFDGWGVSEVVSRGTTGLLVPPFDHQAFADAVAALLSDPDRRREMGACATRTVRELHDLNRNYARVPEVLRAILKERSTT